VAKNERELIRQSVKAVREYSPERQVLGLAVFLANNLPELDQTRNQDLWRASCVARSSKTKTYMTRKFSPA